MRRQPATDKALIIAGGARVSNLRKVAILASNAVTDSPVKTCKTASFEEFGQSAA